MSFSMAVAHPASDMNAPLTYGRESAAGRMMEMFGPQSQQLDVNFEELIAHEQLGVGQLFKGKQTYLENGFTALMFESHNEFVTELMPMRQYQGIEFTWQRLNQHNALPANLSEGAPAHRITESKETFRARLSRFGLAFTVSAETLSSPDAQTSYTLKVVTMVKAYKDLAEQLGLRALVNAKDVARERRRLLYGKHKNVCGITAHELKMFDVARKHPRGDGLSVAIEEAKRSNPAVRYTALVVPMGTKTLLTQGETNRDFYLRGDGTNARDIVERGSDAVGRVFGDLRLYVVRPLEFNHLGKAENVMEHKVTIGDHYRCEDFNKCDAADYRTRSRNIFVPSMHDPNLVFEEIDIVTAMRNTGRWGTNNKLSAAHKTLAVNPPAFYDRNRLPFTPGFADMFLYETGIDGTYETAQWLGQMPDQGFPDAAVQRVAETIVARVLKLNGDVRKAISNGANLLAKIFNADLDADAVRVFEGAVGAAGAADANGLLPGNEFGTHDYDEASFLNADGSDRFAPGGFVPRFLGSVPGAYTLANMMPHSAAGRAIGETTLGTAAALVDAVDTVVDIMAPLFSSSHPLFSGAKVPRHFTSSYAAGSEAQQKMHAKIAFAQALIDSPKSPIVIAARGAAASSSSPAALAQKITEPVAEDMTAEELRVVNAVRASLARTGSASARAAFADTAAVRATREAYSASTIATSYKRYATSVADSAEDKARAATTSFSLLAEKHLAATLEATDGGVTTANFVHNMLEAVKSTSSAVRTNAVEGMLEAWAATAAPRAGASPSAASSATGARVTTRFVASERALARARVAHNLSHAGAVPSYGTSVSGVFAHTGTHELTARDATRIGTWNRGGDTNELEQSRHFVRRWQAAAKASDVLMRLAIEAVLLAPTSFDTFELFAANDIVIPAAVLMQRPFCRYRSHCAMLVSPGAALGEIPWALLNVMFEQGASSQQLLCHATMWMGAFVKDPSLTYMFNNFIISAYDGGETVAPFTPANFKPSQLEASDGSVFYVLVPFGSLRGPDKVPAMHDIRGQFSADLLQNQLTATAMREEKQRPHFPSAAFQLALYKSFRGVSVPSQDMLDKFHYDGRIDNTVVYQGMQYVYNAKKNDYSDGIMNTGHWGPNIYPGHGRLRCSPQSEHYVEKNYAFSPVY